MKHFFLLFTLLFSTVISQGMYAQEFTVGALKYSVSGDICRVAAASNDISGAVVIPSSVAYDGKTYTVTEIENGAFFKCYSVTSVTIPNSVTVIGTGAFVNCNLSSVTIPNSVTKIGNSAFVNCISLTSVTIPNSVTEIGENAFYHCTYLPSLTIPGSVTKIGRWAFAECERLKDVTVSWDTPLQIHETTFEFIDLLLSNVTLHVPAGTEALYQAAPVWKDFRLATSVGKEAIKQTALYARATDGVLHISGLHTGEAFLIYSISGQLIYKGIARTGEEEVTLPADGVYILAAGEERIKFLSL